MTKLLLQSQDEFVAWDRFASAALIATTPMSRVIRDGSDTLLIEKFWMEAVDIADHMMLERRKRLDPKFL